MRRLTIGLVLLMALAVPGPAAADGEAAGEFDYFVLALSWLPNWCNGEGKGRGAEQCRPGNGFGWILHGLWPQYHRGWPAYCPTSKAPPSRGLTGAMADIMGSPGLAWYQWKKHGTCSGLSAADYFTLSRLAYDRIERPAVFRRLTEAVRLPASVVEDAFLKANPALQPDMITVTCRDGGIAEVRLCLSRSLDPVICGADVRRDCRLTDARLEPVE